MEPVCDQEGKGQSSSYRRLNLWHPRNGKYNFFGLLLSLFLKRLKASGEQSLLFLPIPFVCMDALVVSNFSSIWSSQLLSYITLYLMFVSNTRVTSILTLWFLRVAYISLLWWYTVLPVCIETGWVSCMLNMQRLLSAWLRCVFYELVLLRNESPGCWRGSWRSFWYVSSQVLCHSPPAAL